MKNPCAICGGWADGYVHDCLGNVAISLDVPATHLVRHIAEEAGHEGELSISFGPEDDSGKSKSVWTARYVGIEGDNEGQGESISAACGALVKLLRKWRSEQREQKSIEGFREADRK